VVVPSDWITLGPEGGALLARKGRWAAFNVFIMKRNENLKNKKKLKKKDIYI
jgi:hypothetical protein